MPQCFSFPLLRVGSFITTELCSFSFSFLFLSFRNAMGARQSTAQKRVYYQVKSLLIGGGFDPPKVELKKLSKWIFSQFPYTSPEHVKDPLYWKAVVAKLDQAVSSGEARLCPAAYWAGKVLILLSPPGELRKNPSSQSLNPRGPSSCNPTPSSSPRVPRSEPLRGVLKANTTQGLHPPPASPRPARPYPPKGGLRGDPGQTPRSTFS